MQRSDGLWLGFFLLPFLIFVVETCLRYSWHALLVGWHMGSDKNGDIEALDSKRLKKAIKKLQSETKKMLRKQAKLYSRYQRESMQIIKQESFDRLKSKSDNSASKENSGNETGVNGSTAALNESPNSNENGSFEDLFEFDASKVEAQLKKAIRKHQAVIVGDFFVGTCWRLQYATCTITMACAAAYVRDVCFMCLYVFCFCFFVRVRKRFL